MNKKFTWNAWNFDCDGYAYIIAKSECPDRESVPDYITKEDSLDPACKPDMEIEEGWCKYQVRTDWEDGDGRPAGGYVVEQREAFTKRLDGKRKPGWFPVWIIRKGEWY